MTVITPPTDEEYFQWIKDNPVGFALNIHRLRDSDYAMLHQHSCSTITEYQPGVKAGAFTERDYSKICSESVEGIETWLTKKHKTLSTECQLCNPLDQRPITKDSPLNIPPTPKKIKKISEEDARKDLWDFYQANQEDYNKDQMLANKESIISLLIKGMSAKDACDQIKIDSNLEDSNG